MLSEDNKFSVLEEFKVGEMKKLILHESPKAVSEEVFYRSNNDPIFLQSFSGSLTLVNFWATWCAPCLNEMPSLSNLQKLKGDKNFKVVTIATMRNSPKSIENFFDKMSIVNLTKYQDPKGKLARSLKIAGLPLTILLNKDNKEVARFIGDADWSSPQALKLIEKAIEVRQRYHMQLYDEGSIHDTDCNRALTEQETRRLHNQWMNDVTSWMNNECLLQYTELMDQLKQRKYDAGRHRISQAAQHLKKQRFNKVLNDIAVKKQVFMRFVQYPNIWQPSGIHLFLDVLQELKNRSMEAR